MWACALTHKCMDITCNLIDHTSVLLISFPDLLTLRSNPFWSGDHVSGIWDTANIHYFQSMRDRDVIPGSDPDWLKNQSGHFVGHVTHIRLSDWSSRNFSPSDWLLPQVTPYTRTVTRTKHDQMRELQFARTSVTKHAWIYWQFVCAKSDALTVWVAHSLSERVTSLVRKTIDNRS